MSYGHEHLDDTYEAHYYTKQLIDHFNSSDERTFSQKFFKNFNYYKPGGPVIIYIGGEGPLTSTAVSGRTVNEAFAKNLSGGTVALEHRFYGESQPFDNLAVEHLHYLTSHQALHDLAQFQSWFTTENSLQNSTFFCMGGSYPGNLAAWYRLEFPDLTAGCWSASGPVQAVEDWPGFGEMVWRAMSTDRYGQEDTATAVKLFAGYVQLAALIQDPTPDASAQVKKLLNACPGSIVSQDDRDNWEVTLTNYPGLVMQYNNSKFHLHDFKKVTRDAETPLEAAMLAIKYVTTNQPCNDFSIQSFYKNLENTSLNASGEGKGNAARTWTWQTCNEFGYFQTARATNLHQPNFYTRAASSRSLWQQVCADIFDISESSIGARIAETNRYYGGKDPRGISHVFYTNGELDAWSLLSITEYPNNDRNVFAMVAPLGSHCVGMYPSGHDGDLPGAALVRNRALELFTEWNADHQRKQLEVNAAAIV